ncbi:nuclease [Thermocladium modestius]|uniref:Nuclease n=1 Tax=Thermocladium modestius TaxID=62609 RepID=A0A830GYN3_9CREN|nr:DUF790 family protein [Thermocladium modestius]GGP21873.1 nuclease [Thermocladium modestius]
MLPLNLIRIKFTGRGQVKPRYIDEAEAEVVYDVIYAFKRGVGMRLGDVIRSIEYEGSDPRLVGGLIHLLKSRTRLEDVDEAALIRMRLDVFREAAKLYPVTRGNRGLVLSKVAEKFGSSPERVDADLLKIYDDERVIVDFKEPEAEELIREYNLSLAQALLFKALDVEVETEMSGAQSKVLLRQAKLMGLMYVAESSRNGIKLAIDGPVSAIKQTDRYGTRLAKLLPLLVGAKWSLRARIKLGDRVYYYEDSSEETRFPRPVSSDEPVFDSYMEADFYRRLLSICKEVKREPEPLVVDGRIFIPDFKVGDAYIELVGYWSPQYLERKYDKLLRLKIPIIVLVDEKLATAAWRKLPHFVVAFKDRPRITDIYRLIKNYCK